MRALMASSIHATDMIGLMSQMLEGGSAATLGGGMHTPQGPDAARSDGRSDARSDGRSDRVAGVRPGAMNSLFASGGSAEQGIGGPELGTASLSGASARSDRPEAMLARGSRVTGSGGAASPGPPTSRSARPPAAASRPLALPSGGSVTFVGLTDLRPLRFL